MNISVGMFKDPSLMGTFHLTSSYPTANITPIKMISLVTIGSLESFDPWVVPRPNEVNSYGASMSLMEFEIVDPSILLESIYTRQHLHPHMECNPPTPHIQVIDSPNSHDFLDTELPSKDFILEFMSSIDNPMDEVMHRSFFPFLELMRVIMTSLNRGLGEFVWSSSEIPSLDPFLPRLSFLELSTEFSTSPCWHRGRPKFQLTMHQQALTTGPFENTYEEDAVSLEVAIGGCRKHMSTARGNSSGIKEIT